MHSYENSRLYESQGLSKPIGQGSSCPSVLHFVPRHRRGVEGRSSGSKDTLPFGPETSGSKERA
ncbi:MAG: hypothetical protein KAW02_07190, partial [candidate division Zixibacteria bacterium]|nr:hypothetical protein [candidate division Zixibacteria bacterium]